MITAITSIDWLGVIETLASLITAGVAFYAMRSWRQQDKAKRQAEFLDALIDSVHAYLVEMSKPILQVEIAQIAMASYISTWESGQEEEKAIKGAISFIEKAGEHSAKLLGEALAPVEAPLIRLMSLITKGQLFKFKDYAKCQSAIELLIWQHSQIEAFTARLAITRSNWEHPDVQKSLNAVVAIDANSLRDHLRNNNNILTAFVTDAYKRIYG